MLASGCFDSSGGDSTRYVTGPGGRLLAIALVADAALSVYARGSWADVAIDGLTLVPGVGVNWSLGKSQR